MVPNRTEDQTTNVDFDKDQEKRCNKNFNVFERIVQVVKFCAKQGLPLRGNRDNSAKEFTRDGNFMAILKGFANINPLSNSPKNAQMNS